MMKKISLIIAISLCVAISSLYAQNLKAYLYHNTFFSTADGPYVETYISIVGSSVKFLKNDNGKYQGSVEITMMFKLDNEIKDFKKYELLSPETDDSTNIFINFIDQQRFLLPNGNYDFDILIADKNTDVLPIVITQPLTVDFPYDKINISGIEFIESFSKSESPNILTKSGFDLVPYVSNFFPEEIDKITFYSEVYNTSAILGGEKKFLVTCYIEGFEHEQVVNDFIRYKREETKQVNILFNEFSIRKLPTGNYNLVIEVRDKKNNPLASRKVFFQRSNPNIQMNLTEIESLDIDNTFVTKITDQDTLTDFMRSLYPISSQIETAFANRIVENGDVVSMQKYFYNFWLTRDNLQPKEAWLKYYEEVKKVNAAYKVINQKGHQSDRGRVYLQYGPPNAVAESYHEPNAYPYEIWHYYELKGQRNKKFVFYCRELATNDFELIHSDAVGELSNYQWQFVIHERGDAPYSIDQQEYYNHWGSKINDYYNTPR